MKRWRSLTSRPGSQKLRTALVSIVSFTLGAGLVSIHGAARYGGLQETIAPMAVLLTPESAPVEKPHFESISDARTTQEDEGLQAIKDLPQLFLQGFTGTGAGEEAVVQHQKAASHTQQRQARQGVPLQQRMRQQPVVTDRLVRVKQDVPLETKGRKRSGPILNCEQFEGKGFRWPEGLQTIALVGNGPLKSSDRKEIEGIDLVLRFNKLQSYKCGEKMDVWVVRHGDNTPSRYWGIDMELNKPGCSMQKLLAGVDSLWLVNGGDAPFHFFLSKHPEVEHKGNYVWVDARRWVQRYFQQFDPQLRAGRPPSSQDDLSPSSGWLLVMMMMDCAPEGAEVHVYGFNWAKGQWYAHKTQQEEDEIHELAREGRIIIHPTQCEAKHTCKEEAPHKSTQKSKSWRSSISELLEGGSADSKDSVPSF